MRTLLLIALILGATTARADTLPDGCFVAFSNTSQCYTTPNPELIQRYLNNADNINHYGQITGICFNFLNLLDDSLKSCVSNRAECITDVNSLTDSFNSLKASFDSVYNQSVANYNAYKKQLALVKKLKRACGAKCRTIR